MPLRLSLCLLSFLLVTAPAFAEDYSARRLLPNLLENQKAIWTFPVTTRHWESDVPWILIGVSAASFSLDHEPSLRLRQAESLTGFNGLFASRTSDYVLTALPVALLAAGGLSGNDELMQWGWKTTEAAFTSLSLSLVLKAATQRPRPHNGNVRGFWESGNSFPSGHSIVAMSVAAATSNHFKEHRWVKWVVFPAAGLIACSRVSSGHHYASDAVVGSVLGFAIGHYVIR
jgi:membrane-associated phospholipid phosphatase